MIKDTGREFVVVTIRWNLVVPNIFHSFAVLNGMPLRSAVECQVDGPTDDEEIIGFVGFVLGITACW